MMANGYTMRNGMFLAMSDSTLKKAQKECPGVLRSAKPTVHRLQALMDFCKWTLPKTGANIGIWLDIAHKFVAIEPSYVGSHTVDGAGNAKSSVEELKWRTSESTPATSPPIHVMCIVLAQHHKWHRAPVHMSTTLTRTAEQHSSFFMVGLSG